MNELVKLKIASNWATNFLGKKITISNIQYLIQYGHINKYYKNGEIFVSLKELENYYNKTYLKKQEQWKKALGEDLNWKLSFENVPERERTKHVHRLHPYKGKFIPQLVEYFLDSHTDEFKKQVFFKPGDIVLDPFVGSGTTLVQANELGIHAIGIDISPFNCLISNVKVSKVNLPQLHKAILEITEKLKNFITQQNNYKFELELNKQLQEFNNKFFPGPEFKRKIKNKEIDEFSYGRAKQQEFQIIFKELIKQYRIQTKQNVSENFLDKWLTEPVRKEIEFIYEQIKKISNQEIKNVLTIILSRTVRSCRATTHSDLATLKQPVYEPYYCKKHSKICKPLFTSFYWWDRYTKDTLKRLSEFYKIRTNTYQIALQGDARTIDLLQALEKQHPALAKLVTKQGIKGIFSSPPYVGMIDYHEQHAYAYELFRLPRYDELEIGPLYKGKGKQARKSYVEGISQVLVNLKPYLSPNYDIFLVANDKYNLYPQIAELAGMKIVNKFKRPVLNRVEKDKNPYAEIIFHLKENK